MRKYLWPVGHVDTSEGMVVRPSSMEWPAKEQAPIEVVATRKGVHFRPAGKIVQVDREGHHGAPDTAAASGSSSPAAAALEQLLATAMAASASPPVAEAPGVASLLASLLAASPVVTKQRSGKARSTAASSPLSGASRHQLNNFLQQVAKAAKPKVVAPPAPKGDPTMVALLALLKGKGAASGGDEKCKNFASTGKCKYGAKCRYTH
ncbi:hypothetical protein Ctob_012935 [Chrysochromulina tobinii]|uniref:C3H1-type domain-containing protein n=1 Tax=Chrysochromulina tobinii TaxID=1460289 RepID=A0A0M0JYD1_9EUKA|nr:hypothetical protein Ctob_012935 [Chrysochromulina tobinii]|eukprot:KOO31133.1 hypothetical protein Ctob_012935 [Chrysochromulina sp. CCMP291]